VSNTVEVKDKEPELEQIDSCQNNHPLPEINNSKALKEWLLAKSAENLKFAHLMFWCILSSMDDTQSLQMS